MIIDERHAGTNIMAYGRLMDRTLVQAHLALTEEHIAQGERHIVRQRDLVDLLSSGGCDTQYARALLHKFEESQVMRLAERDRLRKELQQPG